MIPASDRTVLLRDGSTAEIRPYEPTDGPLLEDLLRRLSAETLRLRFHSGAPPANADRLFGSGGARRFVADIGGALVGAACYIPLTEPGVAELAVVVSDADHGHGVGTRLVERVAEAARREGVHRLLALVLAENAAMLHLLDDLGFAVRRKLTGSEVEVMVELDGDATYLEARDARDHAGAVASLRPLFAPRAIAVVGASRRPAAVGHAVLENLRSSGYRGAIYAVNPAAAEVAGVPAIGRLVDAPVPVDVAVICVPASQVDVAIDDCIAAGVRVVVVVTAGFGESSAAGGEHEAALLRRCRRAGVRLVGPNCLGVLSGRPGHAYDATFARARPPAGNVAISSQSGAVGIALLEQAADLGMGVSSFVSIGNRADVSPNDLLESWEDDPATAVIALYVESLGNPRRFARIARRVAARKPIVALKAGRSAAGARAAASHTASLAAKDTAVDALFHQTGVVRVDTMQELFDVTRLFANQPVPAGNHVAIVANAGGFGILCADACAAAGLEVAELAGVTRDRLRALLPADASVANPVDVLAATTPARFADAVLAVHDDPGVDAVLALHAPTRITGPEAIAEALGAAWPAHDPKVLVTCLIGAEREPESLNAGRSVHRIPTFVYPESAARALGHAARLAAFRRRVRGAVPRFDDVDLATITAICDEALEGVDTDAWLEPAAVRRVLDAAAIRRPASAFATTAPAAAAAFAALGSPPAVVKIVAEGVQHKTDVDGIRGGIESARDAETAFEEIRVAATQHDLERQFVGVTVEEQIAAGAECLIGVTADPVFGPLAAFGTGGIETELLADVTFRITPLTDVDADEMLASVRARRRLDGFRGRPAGDIEAVRDILLRVAYLADEVAQIAELELNPVIALPPGSGAVAVDARIRVRRPSVRAG